METPSLPNRPPLLRDPSYSGAMPKTHHYSTHLTWTGNLGAGTADYAAYSRDHEVSAPGKLAPIPGSSDPKFRGDPTRYNPEELLVASLSQCHMLWYLHLCAANEVVVEAYEDNPSGTMLEESDGSGVFTEVTLRPTVTVSATSDSRRAAELHNVAARLCFIAKSVRFPVRHEPRVEQSTRLA